MTTASDAGTGRAAAGAGGVGRPASTTHHEIERAAFALFDERGFEGTTVETIAERIGVGRRTIFRYFESKNDIAWGRFDDSLVDFRRTLEETSRDLPLAEAVHRGVVRFNDFAPAVVPQHRQRMRLILSTPALQAHSAIRYADWRRVIEQHVARREDLAVDDLLPVTVGHVSLGLALSAYEAWLADDDADLVTLIDAAMGALRRYLDS